MNKMNKKTIIFSLILFLLTVIIIIYFVIQPKTNIDNKNYDDFAKCLAQKNITMYGASWCPHCFDEKKGFGKSFQYVPYVECSDNPKKCTDVKIEKLPTWIFPDGRKLIGVQGLKKLSTESGCSLQSYKSQNATTTEITPNQATTTQATSTKN